MEEILMKGAIKVRNRSKGTGRVREEKMKNSNNLRNKGKEMGRVREEIKMGNKN